MGTVDLEEGSWIAGIFGLGAIFGGLLSAYLGNRRGRKMSLILLAIPDLLGWILVASSQNLGMMLAGRFLAGFAAAGYSPNIQIHVGEITQPQHRGWLSGLTVPITAIGVLTMYVVGSWLPWHFAAASCTPAPMLMVICLMFYWDSPYWYAHIGMDKWAHEALEQFRGSLLYIPLVKRFSRKMLLILSSLVMGTSLLLLGLCMYSHSYNYIQVLNDCDWLPMICIVSFMVAAPMGLCSIPFIYIVEFYPSEMRSLMGGLTIALSNLELFIVVKTFPNLEEGIGDYGVFWLYAFACFGAIIFTLSYIPETKDKDLTKIEHKFAKLRKVVRASPWVTPVPSPSVNSVRKLHFKTHLFTQ